MYRKVKPYMLVNVNLRNTLGFAFTGEVLSFETPDKTAMVRRVPGHQGTLVELPVERFEEVTEPKKLKWVHYATVTGPSSKRGPTIEDPMFPVDMLRYDHAAPLNFDIVADPYHGTKATPIFTKDGWEAFDARIIACISQHRNAERVWTQARWSSFMWAISPLRTEAFEEAA